MSMLSKGTKHVRNLSMLLSDYSPFREAVSELKLSEVKLGQILDAAGLWTENDILMVGIEFLKSEGLKL